MADATQADAWTPLFTSMKDLRASWPQRGWSWDGRLSCVASSFGEDLASKARPIAAVLLSTEWAPHTISGAPPEVRGVAERAGGMRAGQSLMTSPMSLRVFAYGLWWPWGDGVTISLRIGLGGTPREEVYARFRDVFGVSL